MSQHKSNKNSKSHRLHTILQGMPAWSFSALVVIAILWLTLAPRPLGETDFNLFEGVDKVVHALMFGGLTVTLLFDWSRKRNWANIPVIKAILFSIGSMLFGVAIESLQEAMNLGRGFEYADMTADGIGSFTVCLLWLILQKTRPGTKSDQSDQSDSSAKKHRIRSPWLRIPLKVLFWILLIIILVPVIIYIPPMQTLLKDVACSVIKDKMGMDVKIGEFRLTFPLDVKLMDVSAVEATGDTLASVGELVADVKLLPLLDLDVQLNDLELRRGYYRMVSADSSMIMKIRAGLLKVDPGSSANITKSEILLNKALLRDGDISLYMDVWKKEPTPADSIQPSTPFLIKAKNLNISNITFGMSMLPTIDTLNVAAKDIHLANAIIDLRTNDISADNLSLAHGKFKYVAPTAEYVRTHPAPIDTITPPSPPMKIRARDIAVTDFGGVYTIKGSRPLPGFDANYVEIFNTDIVLKNFYNEASTLELPIVSITARERCGLQITQGSGAFRLDSIGITLNDFRIKTPYSTAAFNADLPFALMEMKPDAPVNLDADLSLGLADIQSFMPTMGQYLKVLPQRSPLVAKVKARGDLSNVTISTLDAAMPGVFSLRASGHARNPLDFKRLDAFVDIDGEVSNPSPIMALAGPLGFDLPPFKLRGTASARNQEYGADFTLTTPHGNLAANGNVSLNSERYLADLEVHNLNVRNFMPDLGMGAVTATLHASGAGFNPLNAGAATDIDLSVASVEYQSSVLSDIDLQATLHNGEFSIYGSSLNPDLGFHIDLTGEILNGTYSARGTLRVEHADLQSMGFTPDICSGNADLIIDATATPDKWLYTAELDIENFDWNLPDQYIHLPNGAHICLDAKENSVLAQIESQQTNLDFTSSVGLKDVIDSFLAASDEAMLQLHKKELDVDAIQKKLPPFNLDMNASGNGLIKQFITSSGLSVDTVYATFTNDSLLRGDAGVLALNTGTMKLDTLSLNLDQRGTLLDYKIHMGNAPGTLDEFAQVDLNGYIGSNRLSAYLRQRNIQGEMGYRLGMTAAMMDSTVSMHFTPLKATIAYIPWTLNSDNHIDLNIHDFSLDANLLAKSKESSILIETQPNDTTGGNDLHLNLANIHVQDFLRMSLSAPPLTATVNSDLRLSYNGRALEGGGSLDISNFTYEKTCVGDVGLNLKAGMDPHGGSNIDLGLDVDGQENALLLRAVFINNPEAGLEPKDFNLVLDRFPLSIANAFIGSKTAKLGGYLNGEMEMTGKFNSPILNGQISCDSVSAYVNYIGTTLRFDTVPITVKDNVLNFDRFDVLAANNNPITLDGNVDASTLSDIALNLTLNGNNVQLIGNDKRAKSDLYGNLFVNLDASARGPLRLLDINASLSILAATNVGYNISTETALSMSDDNSDVVRFVSLSDTTQVAVADTVPSLMNMRITANLNIVPGAQATVNLSTNGTDKVQLSPSGNLAFFMNYMGDMKLTGQLNLGNGFARYSIPVIGLKDFVFEPNSYVLWNGDLMNPVINVKATDTMKTNIQQSGGDTHLVNFLVQLIVGGTLSNPSVAFDLSTNDDMTIQNELQSMSAEQRQQQAMNLLLTGQYTAGGMKTANGPIVGNVYSFLASKINSWTANHVRGIDLSFGVDQYNQTENGSKSTTTSYSYQLSKSLFNNKFKIAVGGNYSTDDSADENLTQNLISDISFEYMIKQTSTRTMLVKLFRHSGYESILEGEVTEMGVGFVMKRRLESLRGLFRFNPKRHKMQPEDSVATDSATDSLPVEAMKGGDK
ncbi:MAG: translocation/assembly module TamB [Clostridium sp.]|nr:translocation/assembly module TamB [Prevotella sp.]MCM1428330.1 translocation/assembly module TamB [Clostridium sp.]MCM1474802.1 translocation/assembly module TamB [Muribaculaceae bacterium]